MVLRKCGAISGALAFLFLSASLAQQTQPSTFSGFEGQHVASVEVAARTGVDQVAMQRLIKQQSGQPFSAQAMRESIEVLEQTQLFSQVQVSVTPQQEGLKVVFILQPAEYVGILQFPGAGSGSSYTSLLQAANIPEQSPYVPDMENQATDGLLKYFRTRGYFMAEVTPELQRDEAHRVVNIIFHCKLNRQARIGTIQFTGISGTESTEMLAALHGLWARLKRQSLKPGQRYAQVRIQKSMQFVRDHLKKQNQLAPSLQMAEPHYDPASNRADVTFNITPGPKVSVTVNGAKVSQKTLQRLIPIYEEGAVDQDLVDEGEGNLSAYFQTKGYFDVTTSSHVDRSAEAVNVVYDVDLGAKHHVKGVYFDGDQFFSDADLKSHVFVKKGFLFRRGTYSEQLVKKSVTSIAQLYKDAGFQDVSVEPKVEDFEPEVDVTFVIKEGPQNHVASMQVVGNDTQTVLALSRKYILRLQPGQVFSPKLLETDRSHMLAAYLDYGYLNATVRSSASPTADDPHKMNVTYTVNEGPQARISEVVLLGQQHTKPEFIKEVVHGLVDPERPLSQGNLLQAESNLYDLGIFDWASVKPLRPVVTQPQEEALVKVHEAPLNSMDVGVGLEIIPRASNVPVNSVAVPGLPPISIGNKFTVSQRSYIGPRFSFAFTRHNLRGRAETATIGTILSRLDQRGFFTYTNPRLHGSSWSALANISGERTTENPIYTAELAQASFQVERTLDVNKTKRAILRYSYKRANLYDLLIPELVLPEDRHVKLSTIEGEYLRDTRDKPLDAHRGVYQTMTIGVTSTALGASADFVRMLGQSAFYIPVKPWLTWANNFRFGLAMPFAGSAVPLSERFFTGGADSLRGFPINGAGPQRPVLVCSNPADPATCSLISVPVGGDMLFIVNTEARFPLPITSGLGAVVFYDGGNVYTNINLRQFAENFTHTIGFGLRYRTPVGPVRVDIGHRLSTVPGVKATQYFVTLGQAF